MTMLNFDGMLKDDAVNDELFSLNGEEQLVYLVKQVIKNQEKIIDLLTQVKE